MFVLWVAGFCAEAAGASSFKLGWVLPERSGARVNGAPPATAWKSQGAYEPTAGEAKAPEAADATGAEPSGDADTTGEVDADVTGAERSGEARPKAEACGTGLDATEPEDPDKGAVAAGAVDVPGVMGADATGAEPPGVPEPADVAAEEVAGADVAGADVAGVVDVAGFVVADATGETGADPECRIA